MFAETLKYISKSNNPYEKKKMWLSYCSFPVLVMFLRVCVCVYCVV